MNFRASSPIHPLFPLRTNLACIRPVASLALLDATDNTDSGQTSTDSEAIICLALDLKPHTRWREALGPADWLQLEEGDLVLVGDNSMRIDLRREQLIVAPR
ncbi:hypothetical protein [Trinickia violacea]|uniref:hypothetical protein n=1 Tax=Trinickia violacea TaxID=2571746 RepID=UPI001C2F7375|nr:hypothetical protein [Trinickia violacea]